MKGGKRYDNTIYHHAIFLFRILRLYLFPLRRAIIGIRIVLQTTEKLTVAVYNRYMGLRFAGNDYWLTTYRQRTCFLAGAGIAFVGASPAFHSLGLEKTVHIVGAIIGITAMQVFLCVVGFWCITLSFAVVSGLLFVWKRTFQHYIWWVEIAAFISIALFYAIKLTL